MITAKFGGTAVTPRNLVYAGRCVGKSHKCVVVSAVGKEWHNDEKTTDLLKGYYLSGDGKLWRAIEDKYRRLALLNAVNVDVDELLFSARLRSRKYSLQYAMSLGEELSAKIVAAYLGATYVEAEKIVRFKNGRLAYADTLKAMCNAFEGAGLIVTGGYYGGDNKSRQTFSRGGSDVTGALCAVASESSLYENWTDAYGVCVANPSKIADVATVPSLSYSEMFRLSKAGATVLHPSAVAPCQGRAIPIKIGNFYNPSGPSTVVSNCCSNSKILSVTERTDVNNRIVTSVLHNLPQWRITMIIADFLRAYAAVQNLRGGRVCKFTVFKIMCNADIAELVTDVSVEADLYKYLKSSNCLG